MQIIADLQLHSKYSRATSSKQDLFEISRWASKKGIDLVATGDWTHPLWFREINAHLKEISPGIFTLKEKPIDQIHDVRFLLSTEISSIYSQGGKVRRIHNLIFSPSIKTAEKIIAELQRRGGRLMTDGRPIVGISAHDLLEMVLTIDKQVLFIPAHAWTPWFSLYGSNSGFDSINECFGNLSNHIYAIETGLSSDPAMNWQIAELDTRSIVSFSDAHSGSKLGREATVFKPISNIKYQISNISYQDIAQAIKQDKTGPLEIAYTIEFFPEEGKYHFSGHRSCNIRLTPDEVEKKGIACPVCKKPLTIGVEDRVRKLSSRILKKDNLTFEENSVGLVFVSENTKKRAPFVSMVPLLEILTEVYASPTKSQAEYERLVAGFATEFDILLKKTPEELEKAAGKNLAEAIAAVRKRKVTVDAGFDGVFGKVTIFGHGETKKASEEQQGSLF